MKENSFKKSLSLLARRDHSIRGLGEKLKKRGYSTEDIEVTVDRLQEKGFLKQDHYAKGVTRRLAHKGFSIDYIERFLKNEGVMIEKEFIKECFMEMNMSEKDQRSLLVEKKCKTIELTGLGEEDRQKLRDRLLRFLVSKGHSFQDSRGHVEEVLKTRIS